MAKKGKKYLEAAKLVDSSSLYSVVEAIELAKKTSTVKFDATVEVAFRLGVDTRKNDQQVRGAVVLPKGTGKTAKVLVFAKGDKAAEAEAAGADYVGQGEYITKIQQGWFDFDVIVATPDMMGEVGKIGRVLGPKGLMPNPVSYTHLDVYKRQLLKILDNILILPLKKSLVILLQNTQNLCNVANILILKTFIV